MICASFSRGGFADSDGYRAVWLGIAVFPLFTIEISTYEGTLFALFIATILLVFLVVPLKRKCRPGQDNAPVSASK